MSPKKKLRKAKAVFVGEVVKIGHNLGSEWATVSVTLKVESYWKGITDQFVTVIGAPGRGWRMRFTGRNRQERPYLSL
ncbi:MAG: hypothetical protein ABI539_02965 [Acidobacteriota bacterium]